MTGALLLAVILTAGLHGRIASAADSRYDITPAPEWVQERGPEDEQPAAEAESSGGIANVLVDRQIRIREGWSEYDRFVTRVVNPAGIADASQITINFDPELDRVHVHSVTLRRGGQRLDALQEGRVEVLQRESRLEQATLDGSLTFHLLMSDIRVGDVIDCRYTIEHHNPAWGNRFFGRVLVRWDDPVQRSLLRVMAPARAPLYFRAGESGEPLKWIEGDWQILEWNWNRLPAVAAEADAPSWYEQYPAIQFSQFADWADVVSVELPLFAAGDERAPDMEALVTQLRSQAKSAAERTLATLRFVQEDIRYTGIELGTGAYAPRPPAEVLRHRYGDCKEKALLMVTLLRTLGIDARPALVSTHWMRHLHERLPSPSDFDHAIVRVRLDGKTYWVDPTVSAQGGTLATLAQADFGEALVVASGVSAPEQIAGTSPAQPLVSASSTLDLRAGLDREAELRVSTVYRGSAADELRRRLRRSSAAQLGTQYLTYYRSRYPGISAPAAPDFHDDLAANEITVNESYRIPHPAEAARSGGARIVLQADLISEYLSAPIGTGRSTPLSLRRGTHVAEQILVRLPHPSQVKDEGVTIDTAAFRYESSITHDGNDVTRKSRYRTLTDEVSVESLPDFLKQREAAREDTRMSLTDPDSRPSLAIAGATGHTH